MVWRYGGLSANFDINSLAGYRENLFTDCDADGRTDGSPRHAINSPDHGALLINPRMGTLKNTRKLRFIVSG